MINLNPLIELDRLAREEGRKYSRKRFLYDSIRSDKGRHFVGIVGPRGVGKTILLKQIASSRPDSFYLSLDAFQDDLFETVKAVKENLKAGLFLLDEVYARFGFEADLKKIYDFLNVKIIFTSSMALAMYRSAHDLSRRVLLKSLYPFSLREYLFFRHNKKIEPLELGDILAKRWDRSAMECGEFFGDYLRAGAMPFALAESDPLALLGNILQTVIYKDIAKTADIAMSELDVIARMVAFIGKSGVDGINYSSLSKNLSISKYKAEQYAGLLERAFILHRILPEGTGVLKEPKIVMALPYRLLYRSYEEAVGGLREDFFIESARANGFDICYLKSMRGEKTPDYVLRGKESVVFEIGGKGKGRRQFKGFKTKQKIILSDGYETEGIKRPLFLFGLLSDAPRLSVVSHDD